MQRVPVGLYTHEQVEAIRDADMAMLLEIVQQAVEMILEAVVNVIDEKVKDTALAEEMKMTAAERCVKIGLAMARGDLDGLFGL